MILSHRQRFIFLKTGRTAGTSVEIALSAFCGAEDVITPLDAPDERLRASLGHRGAQHAGTRFFHHIHAAAVQAAAPEAWRDYFKFCVVRNPWDRAASFYAWHYRAAAAKPGFAQFLAGPGARLNDFGWNLYTIGGRIAVDQVCRYENLAADLESVRARLGLPRPLELPRAKASARPAPYREVMNAADAAAVAALCAREIEAFGYRF